MSRNTTWIPLIIKCRIILVFKTLIKKKLFSVSFIFLYFPLTENEKKSTALNELLGNFLEEE